MLLAKNESERIKRELGDLRTKNRELLKLIVDLYHYVEDELGKDVIITMIYRTQAEQEAIYGEGYKKKSPHQFNQAIDIRSSIYTREDRNKIVKYLNYKYNNSNYYRWTTKVHSVGNHGLHFHIQYYKV